MYEISRLINNVIGEDRSRKRDIVRKMGYRDDLIEGYNRLENIIQTGNCKAKIRKRLPKTLNLLPKVVDDALDATAKKLEKQRRIALARRQEFERKYFRPHIWINHIYSKPRDTHLVDHMGLEHWKVLNLPRRINESSWDDQIKIVRNTISKHMEEAGGYDDMFGRIRSFIYCKGYDESYLFTIEGELIVVDDENCGEVFSKVG
ncbi:hypothetical protein MYX76_02295 [Desulfobacterota bacterium AH_259_B03_O07]|nr:hypothetical protein [Desulfobacterota bacterium AH_259_B03_O07]